MFNARLLSASISVFINDTETLQYTIPVKTMLALNFSLTLNSEGRIKRKGISTMLP